ncbi:hypothetical protein CXK86_27995 [Paenibacillus sp. BGI2013]|nr:hypothetical protein [Paenibacillus amylolyticus]OMF43340.1 hypothetical protein BK136_16610 [Paenibacillus amylolyticus]PKQ87823.1 hypothetical protein CXK86_27995 [Paenibacillus sp. BGI2013]
MLRDIEEMLNKVESPETKVHMSEALRCYNAGSYKACVIMSVISAIYDLHMKVKAMASSDLACRELDDKVEQKKRDLEVYEKYLVEQCATAEIDMLNSNEAKELIRCLDTRNDCAHPNSFVCSPEKARDVFTSVIDILLSKPVLFGFRHMKGLIEELEEKSFFPVKEPSRIRVIVEERLIKFHPKAFSSLLKLICKVTIAPKTNTHKKNLIYFLAYSLQQLPHEYESIISPLIEKDQNENELLELLYENIEIINHLNESSIEKIIFKLSANLDAIEVANRESWVKIVLSSRLQGNENHSNSIVASLTRFKNVPKINCVKYNFIYDIIKDENCDVVFHEKIMKSMRKEFILEHYEDSDFIKLIIAMKDRFQFEHWIKVITKNINNWDFNVANKAVLLFKQIDKEVWIDLVSNESKYDLISAIMREALKSGYNSHSCRDLFNELSDSYPELIRSFVVELFKFNESFENERAVMVNLNEKYRDTTISYIKYQEDIASSIIEKLEEWNCENDEVDLKYVFEKLK